VNTDFANALWGLPLKNGAFARKIGYTSPLRKENGTTPRLRSNGFCTDDLMSKIQPRMPKGMRDILPADMQRRHYVIQTITETFHAFGFEPIQTPVLELHETLMGKYGEDAEKLIYLAHHAEGKEELAMRYDLTVPMVRFFAMHENELPLPFKRYQIAPVWRGDRPQRGRYREFYQCDADIVGIAGLEADAEVIALTATGIRRLGFRDFVTKVNTRKLLTGIGQYAGVEDALLGSLYRTIDKTDKIGLDGVAKEFRENGLPESVITKMMELVAASEGAIGVAAGQRVLAFLRERMKDFPVAIEAINDLQTLLGYIAQMGDVQENIGLDFTMVRGLSYYTGPIFESVLLSDDPEERMGSISGGGRYDDMIGLFRRESLPTVGTSFGIERLIDLMDTRKLYPTTIARTVVQVLVAVMNETTKPTALQLASTLRNAGVNTELFMQENKPLGKQIGYADKKGIPLVVIAGDSEIAEGKVKIKRLADTHEVTVAQADLVQTVMQLLKSPSA
jgi:histidyl-tRNA synthetase